jgi:hypothetical protein
MEASKHMAAFRRVIISLLLLAMLSTTAVAEHNDMIRPDTPQGRQALARLREAELVDRMNYQSYLGSRENEVAMYYLVKHRHVVEAIKLLESGEPVSKEDLNAALDTSEAWRYGSTF